MCYLTGTAQASYVPIKPYVGDQEPAWDATRPAELESGAPGDWADDVLASMDRPGQRRAALSAAGGAAAAPIRVLAPFAAAPPRAAGGATALGGGGLALYAARRAQAQAAATAAAPPPPAAEGGRLAARLQAAAAAAGAPAPCGGAPAPGSGGSSGSGESAATRAAAPTAAEALLMICDEEAIGDDAASSDDEMAESCSGGTPRAGAARAPAGAAVWQEFSAKARLVCARVSVYTDCCSPAALAAANTVMARITLPGGVRFAAVGPESVEFQMGVTWRFPSFAVALGSSYFQRLLAALPHLAAAARRVPAFATLCAGLPGAGQQAPVAPAGPAEAEVIERSLRSTQFTCVFLATKIADQVHAYGLLSYMLSALTAQRAPVSLAAAADVELRCLEALSWRLGPYFQEDGLGDNSAELVGLFCGC
ncbi:MAG: hypothetical protein J3K34DRAFT_503504 [Monoraphidium minutum]|nr:MAG: hypothetical protein J3K34DRAFT_503504 [Monoraphidium minutum]